jgi:hypothetical protein
MIGLLAWCFGIANTFAWYNSSRPAYASVRFLGVPNYVCVDTGLQCSNMGTLTCYVYVSTIYGPMITAARDDMSCLYILKETSNIPVGMYVPSSGTAIGVQ